MPAEERNLAAACNVPNARCGALASGHDSASVGTERGILKELAAGFGDHDQLLRCRDIPDRGAPVRCRSDNPGPVRTEGCGIDSLVGDYGGDQRTRARVP